ncbi:MAG: MFS transporter [Verrucomicrobia bacterium]|nr:MFS transporter [Verrucomicrobiota bacterium]
MSIWHPLRNPIFRWVWTATVVSGCCVSAHDLAVAWTLNHLGASSLALSLVSTMAALPFFFFTVPAGAIADMVNRRQGMIVLYVWMAAVAATLSLLGIAGMLRPPVVLGSAFLVGMGFAGLGPFSSSMIPEMVSKRDLAPAITLGSVQMNVAAIAGPALGGLLLPVLGAPALFGLNAVCFLLMIVALRQWRPKCRHLPSETFYEALLTAGRYVRYAPGVQVTLARQALFALLVSAVPSLLPVIGLRRLGLGAASLGMLYTALGTGSVAAAVFLAQPLRNRLTPNRLTTVTGAFLALTLACLALSPNLAAALGATALTGVGWTLAASELWVAGQRAMPSWARGRVSSVHLTFAQGGVALGGLLWGCLAHAFGVQSALLSAAGMFLITLPLARWLSIDFTAQLTLEPAPLSTILHRNLHEPALTEGPVVVTVEFRVPLEHQPRFLQLMHALRPIILRNGAFSFRLDRDLGDPELIRLETMNSSWAEHLLQHERMTRDEHELWEAAQAVHTGPHPAPTRHFLSLREPLFGGDSNQPQELAPPLVGRTSDSAGGLG